MIDLERRWMRRTMACIAFGIVALASGSTPGVAANATAPIAVSATSLAVCIVAATPLAFGNYTASTVAAATTTSTVTATCTNGTSYTLALNAGTTTGSTVAARAMANGSNTLNYGIFTTAAHTTTWGDGTLGTSTQGPFTSNGLPTVYTAYGQVPAGQYATAGLYSDTVTVTVSY